MTLLISLAFANDTTFDQDDLGSSDVETVETIQPNELDVGLPIVNGTATSRFEAVGVIIAVTEDGRDWYPFCSGSLIEGDRVLTAAHCLVDEDYWYSYGYTWFAFVLGTDVDSTDGMDQYAEITRAHIHPDYDDDWLTNDLAVAELAQPLSAKPLALLAEAPGDHWSDVDITYVGWGLTSSDGTSGEKRTTDIPYYDSNSTHFQTYDPNTNICQGDSGGAALRLIDGRHVLAGVNSYTFNLNGRHEACENSDHGAGAARVDNDLDFIFDYASPELVYLDDDGEVDHDVNDFDQDWDTGLDTGGQGQGGQGGGGGLCGGAAAAATAFLLFPILRRRRQG